MVCESVHEILPKVLAGGEAFKYWASLIVEHTTAGMGATKSAGIPLDEKGAPMGALYNVKIKKNHCIPESPHQYAKFSYCVVFGEGVEEISPCIDIGLEKGILEKHGAWIYWRKRSIRVARLSVMLLRVMKSSGRNFMPW